MKKPRVNFRMKRIAEDDWQIVAELSRRGGSRHQGPDQQGRGRRVADGQPPHRLAALAGLREVAYFVCFDEPWGADCIPGGVSPCGLDAGAPPDLVSSGWASFFAGIAVRPVVFGESLVVGGVVCANARPVPRQRL